MGLLLAIPISVATGFIGVGPGFLLVPALMLVGFNPRAAAAMNALAVTPSSFSAIVPHWSHMQLDASMALPLILSGAVGSFVEARLATKRVPEDHLRRILLVVIVAATLYRIARLFV